MDLLIKHGTWIALPVGLALAFVYLHVYPKVYPFLLARWLEEREHASRHPEVYWYHIKGERAASSLPGLKPVAEAPLANGAASSGLNRWPSRNVLGHPSSPAPNDVNLN